MQMVRLVMLQQSSVCSTDFHPLKGWTDDTAIAMKRQPVLQFSAAFVSLHGLYHTRDPDNDLLAAEGGQP